MRNQSFIVHTGRTKKIVLACIMATILCGSIVLLACSMSGRGATGFVAPAYDTQVIEGLPSPVESLAYGSVTAPTGFSVGLCGTMYQQEDGSLLLYLTNPETNDVNILCEIRNEAGELIYRSGVIRPGEYLERLYPIVDLVNEAMPIKLSIYGYELESWYSRGTILMENILQPY